MRDGTNFSKHFRAVQMAESHSRQRMGRLLTISATTFILCATTQQKRTEPTTVKSTTLLRDIDDRLGDDERTALTFRALPVIIVADLGGRIIFEADTEATRSLDPDIVDCAQRRLAPVAARLVGEVMNAPASARGSHRIVVAPRYVLTATKISGLHAGPVLALSIEALRSRENLSHAASQFSLTAREAQILSLVLDGASTLEVARLLHLADTTVHGYFKRLLGKTASRNRSAMIAKILGWLPQTDLDDRR
jgi:DNA-binding CsgD family transcriptional regulator